MKRFVRRMRARIGRRAGTVPRVRADLEVEQIRLGTEYGGWVVAPAAIPPGAVVYSAGVGADVSFDDALVRGWAPRVLRLIDPTPGVLDHQRVASLSQPACTVSRHAVALSGEAGSVSFWPPEREDHVSYSGVRSSGRSPIEVPATTLSRLMAELGDERIDILKMDIEGAEYEVLPGLIDSTPLPTQLLVEYHHRYPGIGREKTEASIASLRSAGYRLFFVSDTGEEYSFVHQSALPGSPE